MNRFSQVTNIVRRDTSDRNTSVLGEVHMVFLGQFFNLLRSQTGVAELYARPTPEIE